MNEILRDRLKAVDEYLFLAMKELFNERIEKEKPQELSDNNSTLGERYRAYLTAIKLIEEVFTDLKAYQIGKPNEKKFNKEL